ncbi:MULTISPECIES: TonB-dependent receptor [unclassified Pedobacter]|uniref:SusC/RagA family TonB-linked outer membrane protein n=1 Tax=unclassified Pedobacter TaxID=2628915 RepID=UPI001DA218C0|nr:MULTISPECIES: TonB-dependent receptor [unclassified Pedobacter]CAH0305364.1 TonB-dependent receptor SusC [Pedobacter sp. Bi36]CAH0314367.1 TonB-dependent receptor SusC [Pedobacter sp. Bi126]
MKYKVLPKRIIAVTFLQVVTLAISTTANANNKGDVASILSKNIWFTDIGQADIGITGKVIDEKTKSPIPGVSVKVKNGKTAAVTDENGVYKINVANEQTVLLFSYIGYDAQEVTVGSLKNINVILKSSQANLDEVVVVGYGTQKKADVTGSVVRANLDDFRNAPTTNVANLLQGTVPGLNVGQVNRAGATPGISIRGQNTLGGNQNVLIILDGVQYNGSLTSINPDDIATIDVLKDASATAVYGAQAANGVILITSRKGAIGRTRISFSSQYATQKPNIDLKPMARDEYLDHIKYLYYDQAFLAPGFTQPNPAFDLVSKVDASMKDVQGNLLPNDFSWYDEATKTGAIVDNQLSVSGGTDKINYLLSGSLTRNSGFINNDVFKRKTIRANIETKATDWLTIGLQSFATFVNEDGVEPNFVDINLMSPLILPWDNNGNLKINPFNTNVTNPLLNYQADDYDRHNYFFANVYGNVQLPVKGLSYKISFGNNYRLDFKNISNMYDANLTGQASKENTTYYDYTFDNLLTYNKIIGKHSFTGTLLYGAIERDNSYTRAYSTGFSRLTLGYDNLQQGTNRFAISNAWKETLNYQMFRLNYNYESKYLFTGTLRRDGFSGFAENNKYGIFPSISAGWDISKESFFKVNWVDNLKLRVGYGVAGNQTTRYSSLANVGVSAAYVFGDGGSTQFGQQVNSLSNPDLRWERTTGANLGLEFTLFKNRLSGVIEYYDTKTTDLLYSVNIPVVTGFSNILTNIGQLNNKGLELSLNSKNINSGEFKWTSALNFARNVNKVVKLLGDLNGDGVEDDLPQSGLFIGQPTAVIYDYQVNGIWQVGEQIPTGYSPGTYRIVDQNGDGAINASDRTVLGSSAPAFRISLLNNFQYKNFTLSIFLNSVQGGDKSYLAGNTPRLIRDDNSIRNNYLSGIDFWSPDHPDGKYPRSIVSATLNPPLFQNRSFVRLQDVSLSYKFSGKLIERMKLQNLNVFVSGRNLATWTKWDGWDPETNQGLTNDGRPVFKGYSVGLNVTF